MPETPPVVGASLTASGSRELRSPGRAPLPVAASAKLYQGAIAMTDGGYLKPAADTASCKFAGIVIGSGGPTDAVGFGDVDNTSGDAGDKVAVVDYFREFEAKITGADASCVGSDAYAIGSNEVATTSTNHMRCGKIVEFNAAANTVWVNPLQ